MSVSNLLESSQALAGRCRVVTHTQVCAVALLRKQLKEPESLSERSGGNLSVSSGQSDKNKFQCRFTDFRAPSFRLWAGPRSESVLAPCDGEHHVYLELKV